jgi:hypothetical protein
VPRLSITIRNFFIAHITHIIVASGEEQVRAAGGALARAVRAVARRLGDDHGGEPREHLRVKCNDA